jgi:hypothetical protein
MTCVLDTNLFIYFLDDAGESAASQRIEQAPRSSAT